MDQIITILGPTATGKTKVAVQLADRLGAEIVSADSRQVYRGMNLGTGKDLLEYTYNGKEIPYHMIDIIDPGIEYNVYEYQKEAFLTIQRLQKSGIPVVLCGGSGLYLEALIKGYQLYPVPENPKLRKEFDQQSMEELIEKLHQLKQVHNKTDIETRDRIYRALEIEIFNLENPEIAHYATPIPSIIFGLKGERDLIRSRITQRLQARLEEGMIDEVRQLIDLGVSQEQLIRYGLEYKYITLYLQGVLDYQTFFDRLKVAIHQFSKRQMTWFRKMERDGMQIHWIDITWSDGEKLNFIKKIMSNNIDT